MYHIPVCSTLTLTHFYYHLFLLPRSNIPYTGIFDLKRVNNASVEFVCRNSLFVYGLNNLCYSFSQRAEKSVSELQKIKKFLRGVSSIYDLAPPTLQHPPRALTGACLPDCLKSVNTISYTLRFKIWRKFALTMSISDFIESQQMYEKEIDWASQNGGNGR